MDHAAILNQLITQGAELASKAHALGMGEDLAEGIALFERISRCVRRSIMLAQRKPRPEAAKRRIQREVEDAIQREAYGAEAEALERDLRERLDSPELEEEIEDRPVEEIILEICRDMGLEDLPGMHPWKRRAQAEIAEIFKQARGLCPRTPTRGQSSSGHLALKARGQGDDCPLAGPGQSPGLKDAAPAPNAAASALLPPPWPPPRSRP